MLTNTALVKSGKLLYNYDMKDIWNYLKNAQKPIVLYGTGDGADKIISVCDKKGIKVSGVFASDLFVRKREFCGMPVTSFDGARSAFGDMIVLLGFGTALPEVIENIKRIASLCELYAPEVPVCGSDVFDADYYNKREREFDVIYDRLADSTSKNVFKSIIEYRLSGDINRLFSCETLEDEPFESFFALEKDETFLDLGAYRGDTVLSFCGRAGTYKEIIAVEPDIRSYKKLCDATAHLKNISLINALAGEESGVKSVVMNGSRGAGAGGAKANVDMVSVDSLNISPTFIKIDVEGAEAAVIKGAASTVARCKPKMQIAAYHRIGDLVDIPKAVLSACGDYKLYLRHNPCLPAWDTNYFFI